MAPNLVFDGKPQCDLVDCRPPVAPLPGDAIPQQPQSIDYLAKDYDSFLRGMLDMLPARLPGWQTRTEADLGMALLELFAFMGDQLSYYQDRVANEGFLRTAVQYESVRKLLSLIDYQLFPGTAAKVLAAVTTTAARALSLGFNISTKGTTKQDAVVFEAIQERVIYPQLNDFLLHSNVAAGSTQAVLEGEFDLYLTPGLWLWFASPASGEWAQLVDPVTVNHVTHITTVNFSAPLQAAYDKASTHINGNGVLASHGESHEQTSTGTGLANQQVGLDFAPLTYVADASGTPQTTLVVMVSSKVWQLVEDFINSGPTDFHYTQSQDNQGYLTVQFGDGRQGRRPEAGAPIDVRYRSGIGAAGMVAPGSLTEFDKNDPGDQITNPQASFGAINPEDLNEARLLGPQTLRQQNRAVTPQDYAEALLAGVPWGAGVVQPLHAKAQFIWSGSWNTVVVSVDFADRISLEDIPVRREALESALEQKRLAGYDVQVEDARYAPMNIALVVYLKPDYFVRQVRTELEKVIGPQGFFAPANFDFGHAVRLSDLYAAVLAVQGVRYITVQRFKLLGDRYPDHKDDGVIEVDPLAIARCDNDPAHPENGVVSLHMCGGKQG